MHYPPQPIRIEYVRKHPQFDKIVTITDDSGQDWHYLQHDRSGALMLGFPVQLYDPLTKTVVHVFQPAGPGGIPYLLQVILPNEDDAR
jgi:hypothetical protein